MDIELPPDFKEFLKLLNAHRVEYLLIGGYAVGYHGYPRATHDLDIWIAVHPNNAKRVVAALRQFGFDMPELSAALFLRDRIVRMGVPPLRIEITTAISGVQFKECYRGRVWDILDGVKVNLINLRHLNQQESQRQAQGFGRFGASALSDLLFPFTSALTIRTPLPVLARPRANRTFLRSIAAR